MFNEWIPNKERGGLRIRSGISQEVRALNAQLFSCREASLRRFSRPRTAFQPRVPFIRAYSNLFRREPSSNEP